ncbi:MAG: TRAP transporter permease [Chloroflexota bacterium]
MERDGGGLGKVENTYLSPADREYEGGEILGWVLRQQKPSAQVVVGLVVVAMAVSLSLYHLVTASGGSFEPVAFRSVTLSLFSTVGLLVFPLGRKAWNSKINAFFFVDLVLIALSLSICFNIVKDPVAFQMREGNPNDLDLFLGATLIVIILELTRRSIGWPMVLVALFFLLHTLFADYFPGILEAPPNSWYRMINHLYMRGSAGIYGVAMAAMANYIVLFLIFGSLLLKTGAGKFLTRFSLAVAGRATGGPAKVAVISSAFFGTVSGSGVANVVTTGSFTIPLMKSLGYRPAFAAAVESVASSGGQIMPPIMGAAAFVIAEFMGISYLEVCKHALIPAILYFLSCFFMVDFEARKTGLRKLEAAECPNAKQELRKGWFYLLPLVVIILVLTRGYSAQMAAFWGIIATLALGFVSREDRMTPFKLITALEGAIRNGVPVAMACAAAGIITGCIEVSGVGLRLTSSIMDLSGGNLLFGLVLVALVSLVLGMGLPTVAVYVTLAAFMVPCLIQMGIVPIAAHMFAFYFGVIALITPPVCAAAFAAAGIAGDNPMRVGFTAVRVGVAAYIVPFMFVYGPGLLMEGPPLGIALNLVTACIGVMCLAGGVQGWLLRRASYHERLILLAAAMALIDPGLVTDLVGLSLVTVAVLLHRFTRYAELPALLSSGRTA